MLNTQNAKVNVTPAANAKVIAIISYSEACKTQTPTIVQLNNVWEEKEANIAELITATIHAEGDTDFVLEEDTFAIKTLVSSNHTVTLELEDEWGTTTALTVVKQ